MPPSAKTRQQKIYLFVSVASFILPLLFSVFILFVLKSQLGAYFEGVFEKKTMDNLGIVHQMNTERVKTYMGKSVFLMRDLSTNSRFLDSIKNRDTQEMNEIVTDLVNINPIFDTIGIADKNGKIVFIYSRTVDPAPLYKLDLRGRSYYKEAAHQPMCASEEGNRREIRIWVSTGKSMT